jgi:hypothetical protein
VHFWSTQMTDIVRQPPARLKGVNNGHRGLAHEPLGCHRKILLHWGELGTRWPHPSANPRPAILLKRALSAEEVVGAFLVARCKVRTSLKQLQSGGLVKVKVAYVMNDRRDRTD